MDKMIKKCLQCEGRIKKKPTQSWREYNKRKYCSIECQVIKCYGTLEERFWAKVEKSDGCWIWQGPPVGGGYGGFRNHGRTFRAHVLSYIFATGDTSLTPKDWICHHCDNPPCVNPEHLYKGDAITNAKDTFSRNRNPGFRRQGEQVNGSKLTEVQVLEIRALGDGDYEHKKKIAEKYSVSEATVYLILANKTWKHLLTIDPT